MAPILRQFRHRLVPPFVRAPHWATLRSDLIAGLTGAVAGAPQGMGFALIAGISPIYGLYSATLPTIVAALVGSSAFLVNAPTNALALVVGAALVRYDPATHIAHMVALTLLVGVFTLLAGMLRLGNLTRYVSNAVMTGFLTGIAILIILGQLSTLTGNATRTPGNPLVRFWDWASHLERSDPTTAVLGVATITLILLLRRTRLRNWSTLIAVGGALALVQLLTLDQVVLVRDIAVIPGGLPQLTLPAFAALPELIAPALALTLIAVMQTAALSSATPQPDASLPSVNRDFIGMGAANLVGSAMGSLPTCGSLSRTSVNLNAGARTRAANAFAGALILVFMLTLSGLIARIPMSALAGQLIAASIVLIDRKGLRVIWRVSKSARASMLVTLAATLLLPLEYSIFVGVGVAMVLYVVTSANRVHITRIVPLDGHRFRAETLPDALPNREPVVISISGNLYFAAVRQLENSLPVPNGTSQPIVIIRLRDNEYLGSTGLRVLLRYAQLLRARGGKLLLSGVNHRLRGQLERTKALDEIGRENVFYEETIFFASTEQALRYARTWLDAAPPATSVPITPTAPVPTPRRPQVDAR